MQQILKNWIIPDLVNIICEYVEETRILVVGDSTDNFLDFLREEKSDYSFTPVYVGKTVFMKTQQHAEISDRAIVVIDGSSRFGHLRLKDYLDTCESAKSITILVNNCDDLSSPTVVQGSGNKNMTILTKRFRSVIFSKKVDKIVYFSCKNKSVTPQQFVEMIE